ncbi:ABC transporter transmembrane domain-containing protein [Sansalvadorimonas verongulae]|uniref:ABC transporter transmembrane domain-containing protein n=1 Tax=Sansalvadorimonas verongulae TaxID=2172824 RepID=UPI0012BCF381|nr:ABC transporter transmembrane domain-containing protein [Sansalvadorimonas verongulae]MTI13954.1 ATP-binding cassette domain-containing protein [Sansalvadorimonas verongulae]
MSIFRNLGWFFRRHWIRYCFCVLFLILVSLIELLPPWLVGRLVDDIQANNLLSVDIYATVGFIALCGVAIYILRNGWRLLLFGGSIELGRIMRARLFHHLTRMSPEFYQRHQTGDLMAHATNDIRALEMTVAEGVLTLVDSIVAGTAVIAAMIWICGWEITAVALVPFPVMAWLMSRYANLLHKRFRAAQEAFSELNNRVQEAVSGVRAVRAHHLTDAQKRKFAKESDKNVNANMQVARVDALFDPTISLCVGLATMSSLGFGAWRISERLMTVGELTTFTIYLGLLIWPMFAFGWLFNIVERGNASLKRLDKLLAIEPDVKDSAPENNTVLDGNIAFSSRGFTYPTARNRALEEFSFVIEKGSFVGLCGRTGSGKTSLFRLLLRQYDRESIDVRIGGVNHDTVSLDALRNRFALVSQEPFLFSASIAENIAFGRPEASREDVEHVAKLACIHDDILGFSEGYETLLGEKGVNLSGGQKQRLTIARALLLDADYLLLDDAFCSLDMQTEARILDNLLNRENPGTVILITHRLTNLYKADQVIVMDGGCLSEIGSHDKLMAERGWYARIFERQAMETTEAIKLSA